MSNGTARPPVFTAALRYSIPVMLGYLAIGVAFGLLLTGAGYPWFLALLMSLVMYAGAGQYLAVGLFSAGAGPVECMLMQLVVNARHMAYGLTMLKRFRNAGLRRFYLIFALTDETFALLSSLEDDGAEGAGMPSGGADAGRRGPVPPGADPLRFMLLVSLLDQGYWVAGSLIGALAGAFIPFDTEGIGFALTALFVVLMIEQMLRVRRPGIFVVCALISVLAVFLLPERVSLLSAMALSLGAVQLVRAPRGVSA
ncbi:MAG: AzlC family ABC transporter permease [Treponema sp.]|jgi:predicted branched-subunit amino acid permease|nr:AzlC family ABC transporter permease [Treponema sp.]